MGRMSFKNLDELDHARINLILDYWYDEGPSDGIGGNSINYTEKMLQIRQGILDDESSRQGGRGAAQTDAGAKGVIMSGDGGAGTHHISLINKSSSSASNSAATHPQL